MKKLVYTRRTTHNKVQNVCSYQTRIHRSKRALYNVLKLIKLMLPIIKKLFVLLFFPCLLYSCTFTQDGKEQKRELTHSTPSNDTSSELTLEQKSAFDALNTLQVSTDEKYRLYSTFAGIV